MFILFVVVFAVTFVIVFSATLAETVLGSLVDAFFRRSPHLELDEPREQPTYSYTRRR